MNWEEVQKAWATLKVQGSKGVKVASIRSVDFDFAGGESYQLGEYTWDTEPRYIDVTIYFDKEDEDGPGYLSMEYHDFSGLMAEILCVANTGALPVPEVGVPFPLDRWSSR